MSEREPSPTSPDEALSTEPDPQQAAREIAMMRKVIRDQERHREGGIEPELADDDATTDPTADANRAARQTSPRDGRSLSVTDNQRKLAQ